MRKFSAHYIISPGQSPMPYGVIELDDQGTILNIRPSRLHEQEEEQLEFYSGIIVPGFINVHCHLELSHLKGKIPKNTGLTSFVTAIMQSRKDYSISQNLMYDLLVKMEQLGTVALGDISNTGDSIEAKIKSDLLCYSFIELFGQDPLKADLIWNKGKLLLEQFRGKQLNANLSPHACYSLSNPLWEQFKQSDFSNNTMSIHHQESLEEISLSEQKVHGNSSEDMHLAGTVSLNFNTLPKAARYLLIHNTFSTKEDLSRLAHHLPEHQLFFGLCPNANLYIENRLPEILIQERDHFNLCIGTDSLASNDQLSILEELKTLTAHFPELRLEELINWACLNGAKSLGLDDKLGSFEIGKRPGIVLIEGADLIRLKLTAESRSRKLM